MLNEESFLAVDHWRQFLNEQELPLEEPLPLDIEDILPPPSPTLPSPVLPAGPPPTTTPKPVKSLADQYHDDPELAKKKYKICRTNPKLCTKRRPETLETLKPAGIYKTSIDVSLEDLPQRLNISLKHIVYTWPSAPNTGPWPAPDPINPEGSIAWDVRDWVPDKKDPDPYPIIRAPISKKFIKLLRRRGNWVTLKSGTGYNIGVPHRAYGTVQTKINLISLGHTPDAKKYPFYVEDISELVDTGNVVSVGHKFGHLSHKTGRDVDISIPMNPSVIPSGQSIKKTGRGFISKHSSLLTAKNLDVGRTLEVLRYMMPRSEKIFLDPRYYAVLRKHAKKMIKDKKMDKSEYKLIFRSGRLQAGCKRGEPNCHSHANHFHFRFKAGAAVHSQAIGSKSGLSRIYQTYAPWYRTAAVRKLPPKLQKAIKRIERGSKKDRELFKYLKDLRRTGPKGLEKPSKEDLETLYQMFKENKFKKHLIEQGPGMPMLDPATQRLQMQKQIIQMEYGPLKTQADDMIFTLNTLEDPRAKQQANKFSGQIELIDQQFHNGQLEPQEAAKKLETIIPTIGKMLDSLMES